MFHENFHTYIFFHFTMNDKVCTQKAKNQWALSLERIML